MKGTVLFIAGLIVGISLTAVVGFNVVSNKMFVVMESKLGFTETIEKIEQSAADHKWGVPNKYDLQAILKSKGYEVDPVHVFSLCKPNHANEILTSENDRMVSSMMPCRVSVFEKDGRTYVSMLNAELFSRLMGDQAGEVMKAAGSESMEVLRPVFD